MADDIEIVINGTDKGFVKTLKEAADAENEMKVKFEKIKEAAEKAKQSIHVFSRETRQAVGQQALNELRTFASGFTSIEAAANLARKAIEMMRAERDKSISSFEALLPQRKEMAQLSTGPDDYQRQVATARRISATYGIPQTEAYELTNAARAGGFERSLNQVALASRTFAPAKDLIPTAASLPTLFEGLGMEQALNLTAAAGTAAKNMTFTGISEQFRVGAQGAAPAGSSPSETAALAVVLSDLFGESTGDRIRAFGGKVAMDQDLRGKGIMGAYDAMVADPKLKARILKDSQELHAVFNKLSSGSATDVRAMDAALAQQMAATGTQQAPLAIGAQAFLQNQENAALLRRDIAKQQAEIANEKELLVPGLQHQTAQDEVRARLTENKAWWTTKVYSEAAMAMADLVSDDPGFIRSHGMAGHQLRPPARETRERWRVQAQARQSLSDMPVAAPRQRTWSEWAAEMNGVPKEHAAPPITGTVFENGKAVGTYRDGKFEQATNNFLEASKNFKAASREVQRSRQNAANAEALGARE